MLWGTLGVGETVADSSACTLEDDTCNSQPVFPKVTPTHQRSHDLHWDGGEMKTR